MDAGLLSYLVFFLTLSGVYMILSLGLNIQWGYNGQINIGIAGFFAIGAYTSAILTTAPTDIHLGGFGMPFFVGALGAVLAAGILAFLIGLITLELRGDYLAIASIGIAEIVRLTLKNEGWLTNGVRGVPAIPKPFADVFPGWEDEVFLAVVAVFVSFPTSP